MNYFLLENIRSIPCTDQVIGVDLALTQDDTFSSLFSAKDAPIGHFTRATASQL